MNKNNDAATLILNYQEKKTPLPVGLLGTYLGSGNGTLKFKDIEGPINWDLFENQYGNLCDANFIGTIANKDENQIPFKILGFFVKIENTNLFKFWGTICFPIEDGRAPHDNSKTGFVSGVFDMETYRHEYRVFTEADWCDV